MIACRTIIGFGFPAKAGTEKAHSDAPGEDEIAGARKTLGWDALETALREEIETHSQTHPVLLSGRPAGASYSRPLPGKAAKVGFFREMGGQSAGMPVILSPRKEHSSAAIIGSVLFAGAE
jgi:hypothetical protein